MRCKYCNRESIIKNGKYKKHQRRKCLGCGRTFTEKSTYDQDFKHTTVGLVAILGSYKRVALLQGLSQDTVKRWFMESASEMQKKFYVMNNAKLQKEGLSAGGDSKKISDDSRDSLQCVIDFMSGGG